MIVSTRRPDVAKAQRRASHTRTRARRILRNAHQLAAKLRRNAATYKPTAAAKRTA